MRRLLLTATIAIATFVTPAMTHAQFAGRWAVQLGEWQTDGGAGIQMRSANSGVLEITMKGDSATATWSTGQANATPVELRGKVVDKKLVVKGTREGRVNMNGEETAVTLNITFEFTAASGELTGVMRLTGSNNPSAWRTAKAKTAAK